MFLQFQNRPADQVVHPTGYAGVAAELDVTVCLDPNNLPQSGDPEQAIRNAIAEFNRNQGMTGNVVSNPSPGSDFESVLLHEIGHCIGMDHPVFGPSEVGSGSPQLYFANAFGGGNNAFDTAANTDGQRGTRDDIRGDDINLNWFRKGVNDPWAVLPAVVDRVSYGVELGDLPNGHDWVEIASAFSPCLAAADSSAFYDQPATQNTMYPVICGNNLLRQLALDDVALLRIARAGKDGTQGTGDDYTTQLRYVGQTNDCALQILFTNDAGFAFCQVGGTGGGPLGNDIAITTGRMEFQRTVDWQFNQTDTTGAAPGAAPGTAPSADLTVLSHDADPLTPPPDTKVSFIITVMNAGPNVANDVMVANPTPAGLNFVSTNCPGGTLPCPVGNLAADQWFQFDVIYAVPANAAVGSEFTNVASASSATDDPNVGNNILDRSITVSTPPVADLAISKNTPTGSAARGSEVVFTVEVSNLSEITAGQFWVVDQTPPGLVFVSNTGACTTAYPCSFGSLPAGGAVTISSTFAVANNASVGALITNIASISATDADPDPANDSASDSFSVSSDPPEGRIFFSSFEP
ncbi:MAG TPA: hypothetical protein VFG21_08720 [Xanthomonadaceae bacterium]|nr:hypothetical protein [Xanthomonadaceae bacterium]